MFVSFAHQACTYLIKIQEKMFLKKIFTSHSLQCHMILQKSQVTLKITLMTKVSTTLIGYVCTAESYATKAVAVFRAGRYGQKIISRYFLVKWRYTIYISVLSTFSI